MRQNEVQSAAIPDDDIVSFRPSRRAILRGGLGAAGFSVLGAALGRTVPVGAHPRFAQIPRPFNSLTHSTNEVAVYPLPGSQTASPGTEISFRGVSADTVGDVTVVGSNSGAHSGVLVKHSDDLGVSFVPDVVFRAGESVKVKAGLSLGSSADGSYAFTVVQPSTPAKLAATREPPEKPSPAPQSFRSRPDLLPPTVTVTDHTVGTAPGLIFIAPRTPEGQQGPMIFDEDGELVWFLPLVGDVNQANDFRAQEYQGQPVLTSWEGVGQQGHGFGHFVIRDDSYRELATLRVANGYDGGDLHEFRITPRNTALICVYNIVRWDLSSVGAPKDGVALDSIIQELDIATGRVLFEWHSLDHIALDESYNPVPADAHETFDYFHLNSVELDEDDNFIVSGRNSWGIYKIDRRTGTVLWRFSGKQSSFTMGEGTATAYQHDARVHPDGTLTIFDNAANSTDEDKISRGIVLKLDTDAMTATLVHEYPHPTNIISVSQGDMQQLPNGNFFIGWGSAPVFSEFDQDGTLLFDGRYEQGVSSYRAYRFPWTGQPDDAPAVAAEQGAGTEVKVYASWNGGTEVATWQVLAGSDPDQLRHVGDAPRSGFETEITVQIEAGYVAARAQDGAGKVLGTSAVTKLGA
jgi:Arylsulfotransferase (ASST)